MTGADVLLERLFSPYRLGHIELRNRIYSPPHGTGFSQGGLPTDRQIAYYEARARGGAAFIVGGSWAVLPGERSGSANAAYDPAALDGHKRMAEAVHRHGAFLAAQLHMGGRQGPPGNYQSPPMLAPSPLPCPKLHEIPKELEVDESDEIVDRFAQAAANMQAGDWDGVEVLAAQGYGAKRVPLPAEEPRGGGVRGGLRRGHAHPSAHRRRSPPHRRSRVSGGRTHEHLGLRRGRS